MRYFRKTYGVELDEVFTEGKGPVVDAVPEIRGAQAHYSRMRDRITVDLGDVFGEVGGRLDQRVLARVMLHESEHYANDSGKWWGDLNPRVPPEVDRYVEGVVGGQTWYRHEKRAYGYRAELVQFGFLE